MWCPKTPRTAIHVALASVLVAPAAAFGQEPVQIDPNSPAGVEYRLPLEQARRDAAPDGFGGARDDASGGGSGGVTPPFGAGISQAGGGSEAVDAGDRSVEGLSRPGTGAGRGGVGDAPRDGSAGSVGTSATARRASSTDLMAAAVVAAVLLGGGGFGLALRRGLRTKTAP